MKVSDNTTFCKTVKPFFTDKGVDHDRILLIEENNNEISEKLNNLWIQWKNWTFHILREKCPNKEFFLVRIFPHSDWTRRDTEYLSVFSPNAGKYEPEKTPYLDTFHAVTVWGSLSQHW